MSKGSKQRPTNKRAYDDNFDRIFKTGKKGPKKQRLKVREYRSSGSETQRIDNDNRI